MKTDEGGIKYGYVVSKQCIFNSNCTEERVTREFQLAILRKMLSCIPDSTVQDQNEVCKLESQTAILESLKHLRGELDKRISPGDHDHLDVEEDESFYHHISKYSQDVLKKVSIRR